MTPMMLALILTYVLQIPFNGAEVAKDWANLKGDHFVIYHQAANSAFSRETLRRAEQYYDKIAKELGYSRRDNFWLWENRCAIYLFESKEAFSKVTQQAVWSSGFAIPDKRAIISYEGATDFLESILSHELAHLIFRDFVGLGNQTIPLWMDEGVAMSQEESRRPFFDHLVKQMISQNKWVAIPDLTQIQSLQGITVNEAAVFYAESQSLARYLLAADHPERFIQMCRDLRDGKSIDQSLSKNYPKKFPSVSDLEQNWVENSG